jgi:hypothetical protein
MFGVKLPQHAESEESSYPRPPTGLMYKEYTRIYTLQLNVSIKLLYFLLANRHLN